MIKVFEYMAFGLPVVLFRFGRRAPCSRPAALYALLTIPTFRPPMTRLLNCSELLDSSRVVGGKRIEKSPDWGTEKDDSLGAYRAVLQAN